MRLFRKRRPIQHNYPPIVTANATPYTVWRSYPIVMLDWYAQATYCVVIDRHGGDI